MASSDLVVPKNRLLSALPSAEYRALQPYLEPLDMQAREPTYEPNQPIEYVYFPENSVVSVLNLMEDGTAVEVATVGNEGMVGVPIFLGSDRTPSLSFVQVPGRVLRMSTAHFRIHSNNGGQLQHLLQRYTQALFVQLSQSVACNRLHKIEQRCCRWLLMTHDRVGSDTFPLTQEFLAQMLGVRRASVSEVASKLEQLGLITYSRGWITVLDRQGLEELSCECYGIIKAEYDRLTP